MLLNSATKIGTFLFILNCATNVSAEAYYCEGELKYDIEETEQKLDPYEANYAPPRPVSKTSENATSKNIIFQFEIFEDKINLHIPGILSQQFELKSQGEIFNTPFYSNSTKGFFLIDHFQLSETRNDSGGNISGAYHKINVDRVKQTISILEQSWSREDDPHQYTTFDINEANCISIIDDQNLMRIRELSAQSEQQKTTMLIQQVTDMRNQMEKLQGLLDLSEAANAENKTQLQNLGQRLNAALARAATEERKRRTLEEAERKRLEEERNKLASQAEDLAKYKSEFFGRMRAILAGQDGVKIVGDRFVFSSEVLFDPGQADLQSAGQVEIQKVATILESVMDEIPDNIDWVIRVDGHTDNIALSGQGQFKDNWELSQARALSVVRYMVTGLGFPPDRLAANGFGEFQPVNDANTESARAQNRRIEIKLTER